MKRKKVEDGHYQSYDGFHRPSEIYPFGSRTQRPSERVEQFSSPMLVQKEDFREPPRSCSSLGPQCSHSDRIMSSSKAPCLQSVSMPSSSFALKPLETTVQRSPQQNYFAQCPASESYFHNSRSTQTADVT